MKTLLILLTGILFLTACSPSPQAIQTAMAKTQDAYPTSTFTPFPPTETPTQTATESPTTVPSSFIMSVLHKYGYVDSFYCSLNVSSGVFNNGVAFDVYCETTWATDVLVGNDGSFVIEDGAYKAQRPNETINNVLYDAFGNDVRSWVADNYALAQSGAQRTHINTYYIEISVVNGKNTLYGGTAPELIIKITPKDTSGYTY